MTMSVAEARAAGREVVTRGAYSSPPPATSDGLLWECSALIELLRSLLDALDREEAERKKEAQTHDPECCWHKGGPCDYEEAERAKREGPVVAHVTYTADGGVVIERVKPPAIDLAAGFDETATEERP